MLIRLLAQAAQSHGRSALLAARVEARLHTVSYGFERRARPRGESRVSVLDRVNLAGPSPKKPELSLCPMHGIQLVRETSAEDAILVRWYCPDRDCDYCVEISP